MTPHQKTLKLLEHISTSSNDQKKSSWISEEINDMKSTWHRNPMDHPLLKVIAYLSIGFSLNITLGLLSYLLGKKETSDEFLVGALDHWLLFVWPLALPFSLYSFFAEKSADNIPSEPSKEEGKPSKDTDEIIGKIALTVSDLRPSGTIRIGSKSYDALSQHQVIPSGTKVVVTSRDDLRVIVKRKVD